VVTSIATSDAKQKVHAKGKVTARDRIYALLDDDSFVELDALAKHRSGNFGLTENRPLGDCVVTRLRHHRRP
jgi:propionyl-CoA carboxylase beta chain